MATILTYHQIADVPPFHPERNLCVSPASFEAQMEFLRQKGWPVVSLDSVRRELLGEIPLPLHAVALTFDDAARSVHVHAAPILRRYGFTATVFVVANQIQTEARSEGPDSDFEPLTRNELIALVQEDLTIGSHAQTHRRLAELLAEECEKEVAGSKQRLESLVGQPVHWFSYPYGSFNLQVVESVRRAGYHGATSAIRDNRNQAKHLYYLHRVMVMQDTTLTRFRYYFSWLYHYVHKRKNQRRWKPYL
jgi:peptidoglycan/xylan/chitin deacetylase (PgdA/CDA1 family)